MSYAFFLKTKKDIEYQGGNTPKMQRAAPKYRDGSQHLGQVEVTLF
jgi:hypothetical protein